MIDLVWGLTRIVWKLRAQALIAIVTDIWVFCKVRIRVRLVLVVKMKWSVFMIHDESAAVGLCKRTNRKGET